LKKEKKKKNRIYVKLRSFDTFMGLCKTFVAECPVGVLNELIINNNNNNNKILFKIRLQRLFHILIIIVTTFSVWSESKLTTWCPISFVSCFLSKERSKEN
jgi:hypothetical protein